jgi:branched-chain amino acid transport system substrate-binding protein
MTVRGSGAQARVRAASLALMLAASVVSGAAQAEIPGQKIVIGVLTDMNGGNASAAGPGSVVAAQLAAEDAAAILPGVAVQVISADHENKADLASSVARRWMAGAGVNVVADVPFSSAGLAVSEALRGAPRTLFIASGPGTSDLTGPACSPNTVHWTYDTYALANSVARALLGQGQRSWYFVSADYAFGASLERDATRIIDAGGGTVVGSVKNPAFAADFSSYLLTAQNSRAQVIALANASIDLVNLVKQAHEFGLVQKGVSLAGLLTFISDVHAIGLETGQGLVITNSFYWDANDRTRAFSERLRPKFPSLRPGMIQAGDYSGTLHYLKAVKELGLEAAKKDGAATVAQMKKMPTEDDAFGPGSVRADGRVLHPAFLWQVKSPAESKGPWDYLKLLATTPTDEAFRPVGEGKCSLVV